MSFKYLPMRTLFATGQLNWNAATPRVMLVSGGYQPSPYHATLVDVPNDGSRLAVSSSLTDREVSDGWLRSGGAQFNTTGIEGTAIGAILYLAGVMDSGSSLLAFYDDPAIFPQPLGKYFLFSMDGALGGWFRL